MNRALRWMMLAALAVLGAGCGMTSSSSSAEGGPGGSGNVGKVHVYLSGEGSVDTTIVIQDVFDSSRNFLVECEEKPETLDGQTFCDELLVLPPGVYQLVVQTQDPSCRTEQDHYKVVVTENQTVELQINVICYADNGGLDVIVGTWNQPALTGITFTFETSLTQANKFVCQFGENVWVQMAVTDEDTPCTDLDVTWSIKNSGGGNANALILEQKTASDGNTCFFSVLLDASAALDDYDVTFTVDDGNTPANSFTFPIHLIDCGNIPGQCNPPLTDCSGTCVDLQTDEANCGTCGNACALGQTCQAGTCTQNLTCIGEASTFALLGLENGSVIINSSTAVTGDFGYSKGVTSTVNQKIGDDAPWIGGAYVDSQVAAFAYSSKDYLPSDGIFGFPIGSASVDARLAQANLDALSAAALYGALTPDITLGAVTTNTVINRTDSMTVVRMSSVNLNGGTIILNGNMSGTDTFVIQVLGDMDFSQSQIVLNNVTPDQVVWVFPNPSDILINKDTSVFQGTILAPTSSVEYHNPATFNGAIIALNINVHSDFNLTHHPLDIPCP